MIKRCKNCKKIFNITLKHLKKSKIFCSLTCSQHWWMLKRNKTGKFFGESKKFGILSRKTLHLTNIQKQIIIGSMFGDGYIGEKKNKTKYSYYYSESHSIKQKDYLLHKMQELNGFVAQKIPTHIKPNGYSLTPKCSFTTIVHDDFKNIFNLFYKVIRKKKFKIISFNNLNLLKPLGLLYWYLDDGCITRKNTINLSTYSFTLKEHILLKKWFKKRFNIISIISYDKTKKLYYLRFNVKDSKKFLSLIIPLKHKIPIDMHYKLPIFSKNK